MQVVDSVAVERVQIAPPIKTPNNLSNELDDFRDYMEERKALLSEAVLPAVNHTILSGQTDTDLSIKMDDLPLELAKAKVLGEKTFFSLAEATSINKLAKEVEAHGFGFNIQANRDGDSYAGKIEVIIPSEMLSGNLGERAVTYERVRLLGFMFGHTLNEEAIQGTFREFGSIDQALRVARSSYNHDRRANLEFDLDFPGLTVHTPKVFNEDFYHLVNGDKDITNRLTDEGKLLLSFGLTINHIYEEYLIRNEAKPFTLSYVLNEIRKDPNEWLTPNLRKNPMTNHEDLCKAYIERLKAITRPPDLKVQEARIVF